jgi:hypothetical protein
VDAVGPDLQSNWRKRYGDTNGKVVLCARQSSVTVAGTANIALASPRTTETIQFDATGLLMGQNEAIA